MLELGEFIKERRESAGLSFKKLSTASGVSDTEIMKIENGTRKNPSWNNLCRIAKALKFHPFEILLNAGYISIEDIHPISQLKGLDDLSESELEIIQLFIDFIKTQRGKHKPQKGELLLCHTD